MNTTALKSALVLFIGLGLGGLLGLVLMDSRALWLLISVAVFLALIAWWQTPCIRVALSGQGRQGDNRQFDDKTLEGEEKKPATEKSPAQKRLPCLKHWLIRLSIYWFLVSAVVIAQALWWTEVPLEMNRSSGSEDKEKQALPYSYALKRTLWQLGIIPLPEFIRIPEGEFEMGSATSGNSDEQPVHTVSLKHAFRMSRYEITFAEYDYYVWSMQNAAKQMTEKNKTPEPQDQIKQNDNSEDKKKKIDDAVNYPFDEGWGRGNRPVINVSWDDAQGYVNWLSKKLNKKENTEQIICRLPTEAEWEYAARAGSTTAYPWGDEASHEQANYGKDECCDGLAKGRDQWVNTSPVGSFPTNQFGLQDMHGNVWEWVQDCYTNDYSQSSSEGSASEKASCDRRVLRGGSWYIFPDVLRSALRGSHAPDYRYYGFGFRVVCSLPSAEH